MTPETFTLESLPSSYLRRFRVGAFVCLIWKEGDSYRWSIETEEGSEKAKGSNVDPGLAESDARKAAIERAIGGLAS